MGNADDDAHEATEETQDVSDQSSSDGGERQVAVWQAESELGKLSFCAALLVFSQVANAVAIAINHDIVWREPLQADLTANLFQLQDGIGEWSTELCTGITGLALLGLLLLHKARRIVLRRYLFLTSTLYLFRSACLCATQLPPAFQDSLNKCHPPLQDPGVMDILRRLPWLLIPSGFLVSQLSQSPLRYCGDSLFSGSVLLLLCNCFTLNYYTPKWGWPIRWALVLVTMGGFVAALLSRLHYTCDIFTAYVLTTGCFTIYHTFCEIPKERRRDSAYYRLWMFWLMVWLENDIPAGRIRNQLSWPFERPLWLHTKLEHWNRKCQEPCCRVVQFLSKYRFRTKM